MSQPYCPRMLRFLMIIALTGLMIWSMKPAYAQSQNGDWKTLAVFSMTSTDEGAPLIKQLLTAAGHDGLLDEFEQQQREAFKTLDFSQPKGGVWQTNGRTFRFLGFMAMSDMTKLPYTIGETIADSETMGEGWVKIPMPNSEQLPVMFKNVYAKQQGNWGWFCYGVLQPPRELPNDPVVLLEGLPEEYPVALRLQCANMPRSLLNGYAAIGKQFIPMIKLFLPQSGGEEEQKMMAAYFNFLEVVLKESIDQMVKVIKETETFTIGLRGNDDNDVFVDMQTVAKPGTDTAETLKQANGTTTKLSGFFRPKESGLSYIYATPIPDYQKGYLKNSYLSAVDFYSVILKTIRQTAEEVGPDELPEMLDKVEALLAKFPTVIEKTVDAGELDFVLSHFGQDGIALCALRIADGNELLEPLDALYDLAQLMIEQTMADSQNNGDFSATPVFKKESYKGVQLWSVSIQMPSFEDAKAFSQLAYVVGLSDEMLVFSNSFYVDVDEASRVIKKAIDESGKPNPLPREWMVFSPHNLVQMFKQLFEQFPMREGEEFLSEIETKWNIPEDANIVMTQKIEKNAMTQTLTISGKLWPVIGVAVERIIEENGGMPF